MIWLAWLLPVVTAAGVSYVAYKFGYHEGRASIREDREALARAAHNHFCVVQSELTHDPDEIDYDKADEVIEILWCLDGAS